MWKEFKKFAFKGNVFDMAVGVMIGAAFGKIVTSLVNDIIMPPLGILIGGINFSDLKIVLAKATETSVEVSLNYGNFIQVIFDFLIISISIFTLTIMIAKGHEIATKRERELAEKKAKLDAAENAKKPKVPTAEELLIEIRDCLKDSKKS